MAELHCFGSIIGASGFGNLGLFAKWRVTFGANWQAIEGCVCGDTQIDYSKVDDCCYWSHPIDIHFTTCGVQNWPKFEFQIFQEDEFGRITFISYGFIHVPSSPGFHRLKCHTWRPIGNLQDRIHSVFTDSSLVLKNLEMIYNSVERSRIQTESKGTVIIEIYIIARNFDKFGVELS